MRLNRRVPNGTHGGVRGRGYSGPSYSIKEPLNKLAAALSGSFVPAYRFENLEIHKVFLRFPNLNLEQNPSLTALAIESELPKNVQAAPGWSFRSGGLPSFPGDLPLLASDPAV